MSAWRLVEDGRLPDDAEPFDALTQRRQTLAEKVKPVLAHAPEARSEGPLETNATKSRCCVGCAGYPAPTSTPAFSYFFRTAKKKAPGISAKCLISLVGGTGFEPVTPAV
jgi:hypothetical protein